MKFMRKVAIGVSGILVLVVIAVVLGIVFIDKIAKSGIEKGGTYALGVDTKVDSVSVGLFTGQFGLTGLNVSNPAGFKSAEFMRLSNAGVAVSTSSLQKPVVELPNLSLSTIRVNLERSGGKSNYQTILDNLAKMQSKTPQQKGDSQKKFIVKELTITDVNVHLDLLGIGGELTMLDVPIDKITLKNIGSDGSGVDAGELTGIVVRAVLAAAVEKGGGLIPADIAGEITSQLGKLGNIGEMGVQAAGQVTKTVTELGKEVGKVVEGVGKEAEKAADELKKGIEGIFPGKK